MGDILPAALNAAWAADPQFVNLAKRLYGPDVDVETVAEDLFGKKLNDGQKKKLAQVSNGVGIAAGSLGLIAAAKDPRLANGGRVARAINRKASGMKSLSGKFDDKPAGALLATGALGTQAGNLAGDGLISTLLKDPKKPGKARDGDGDGQVDEKKKRVIKSGPSSSDVHAPGGCGGKKCGKCASCKVVAKAFTELIRTAVEVGALDENGFTYEIAKFDGQKRDSRGKFSSMNRAAAEAAGAGLLGLGAGYASLKVPGAAQGAALSAKAVTNMLKNPATRKVGLQLLPDALKDAGGAVGLASAGGVAAIGANHNARQTYELLSASGLMNKPLAKRAHDVVWEGEISKADEDKRQVFGWASVTELDGEPVVDLQGDYIHPDEMERAAYDYVIKSRVGGDMHTRVDEDGNVISKAKAWHVSDLIESVVFTPEKCEAMGVSKSMSGRWWVGFKVNDDEVWKSFKSGERKGFSIHGVGARMEKRLEEIDPRETILSKIFEESATEEEFYKNAETVAGLTGDDYFIEIAKREDPRKSTLAQQVKATYSITPQGARTAALAGSLGTQLGGLTGAGIGAYVGSKAKLGAAGGAGLGSVIGGAVGGGAGGLTALAQPGAIKRTVGGKRDGDGDGQVDEKKKRRTA